MNNCGFTGRPTKDPDLRYTPNGVAVATFTLAVQRDRKNNDNQYEADFLNMVVWNKAAEFAANYIKKGKLIEVVARAQSRSYDGQDGKKVYVTEFLVEKIKPLEWADNGNNGGGHSNQGNNSFGQQNSGSGQNGAFGGNSGNSGRGSSPYDYMKNDDPFANQKPININDDDLPF